MYMVIISLFAGMISESIVSFRSFCMFCYYCFFGYESSEASRTLTHPTYLTFLQAFDAGMTPLYERSLPTINDFCFTVTVWTSHKYPKTFEGLDYYPR